MKSPLDHARALLKKAANDLIAADATLSTELALDTVCTIQVPPASLQVLNQGIDLKDG